MLNSTPGRARCTTLSAGRVAQEEGELVGVGAAVDVARGEAEPRLHQHRVGQRRRGRPRPAARWAGEGRPRRSSIRWQSHLSWQPQGDLGRRAGTRRAPASPIAAGRLGQHHRVEVGQREHRPHRLARGRPPRRPRRSPGRRPAAGATTASAGNSDGDRGSRSLTSTRPACPPASRASRKARTMLTRWPARSAARSRQSSAAPGREGRTRRAGRCRCPSRRDHDAARCGPGSPGRGARSSVST